MKNTSNFTFRLVLLTFAIGSPGIVFSSSEKTTAIEFTENTMAQNTLRHPVIESELMAPKSKSMKSFLDGLDGEIFEPQGILNINVLSMAEYERVFVKFPVNINHIEHKEEFSLETDENHPSLIMNYVGNVDSKNGRRSIISIDPESGNVVGTIHHDGELYRIKSARGSKEIYFYKIRKEKISKEFIGNKKFVMHPTVRDEYFELNKIHERKLMRDSIDPSLIRSRESNFHSYLQLIRGNIGKIDLHSLVNSGDSYIEETVKGLSPFLQMSGDEHFEIYNIEGDPESDGNFVIEFRQMSYGIPINEINRIEVESSTGNIVNINFKIYDSAKIEHNRPAWIDEGAALNIAFNAIGISNGSQKDMASFKRHSLFFQPGSDKSLHPYWRFVFTSKKHMTVGHSVVTVDAISGEFRIDNGGVHADYEARTKVCIKDYGIPLECPKTTGNDQSHVVAYEKPNPNIPDPEEINAIIGWAESPFDPKKYSDPFWIINNAENNWNLVDDIVCCFPGEINVVLDTPVSNPVYWPSTDTILFPPKDTASQAYIQNGEYYSSQKELVVHERAHRLMIKRNPDFGEDAIGGRLNVFLRSLGEGLADVMAATTDGRSTWKSDWVFGDGFSSVPRDAKVSKKFLNFSSSKSYHENGTIFSNFFYRVSRKEGVSSRLTLKLAMRVGYHIKDEDSDGYDWTDFWVALEASVKHINNADLTEAISETWSEMDPQGTAVPSIPLPPPSIWGSFVGCEDYGGRAIDLLEWTDVATSYAVYYRIRETGVWMLEHTTTDNNGYAYTPVDIEWKVKSCETGICGPLSSDSYFQRYDCRY
ncbi:hypothetical protein ACONUD_18915 [Microbulbifer harenosus]|uniref:Uncharacterized protein n=1 Tax=Microbulbifer harenosus TaxID=2576840 RepID=A0ABY2UE73_9GAMM|nr:hypothetical protein [Microbulbifer harenosus]TLM75248.1 hypothetical protein FDY93_16280 [Microbulbifer harenosus]